MSAIGKFIPKSGAECRVQALSAQKSKRAATPSGVVGALAILSAFCLLTEEMLTPVTML